MNRYFVDRSIIVGFCCFIVIAIYGQVGLATDNVASFEQGLKHYENNEPDKAIEFFKEALVSTFPDPPSGRVKEAVDLAGGGKTKEAEDILQSLFDGDSAARARYELGLIYEKAGNSDGAATLYRNALTNVILDKGASYVGKKACKMCHTKQYKSWEETKMAQTFEVLKPGVRAEAKTKLKFDPQKDYTKTPECLECHTTGFGMPGGYIIAAAGDSKAERRAKENGGTTCEACHGPGSEFKAVHKKIMSSKEPYTLEELSKLGQRKVDAKVCNICHNRRNPTVGSDFQFDYEKYKTTDVHENIPLKYRAE